MSFRFILVVLAATLATAPSASELASASDPVATVHPVKGRVLANHDEVFLPIPDGHVLQVGDRVLLLSGAVARVSHSEGCEQTLAGPRMVRVKPASACSRDVDNVAQGSRTQTRAFDGAAFFARVGGLGRVEPEDYLDALGP